MSNEEIALHGYLQKSAEDGTLMETLKELGVDVLKWVGENPELAGGIAGGLGGVAGGALRSDKGDRLRTAILTGLAGTAGGAGAGYMGRKLGEVIHDIYGKPAQRRRDVESEAMKYLKSTLEKNHLTDEDYKELGFPETWY